MTTQLTTVNLILTRTNKLFKMEELIKISETRIIHHKI